MMGKELDPHLANPPQLNMVSMYYLEVFNLLGTCRGLGYGAVGPIPYTAISQYARDFGIAENEMESLVYIITTVDAEVGP
ncbi:tail chaperonin [Stenotrophomonas phage Salva]|uniref:Tape measure chaperone n=1 Tax=Stenotrophomonas phage Salva TaxID=2801524 RepID=A0A8B6Q856_9CAUD|nr:tail chaperonin [Stenotrophomonas phage Salva]QQM18211.1 tape measure chaperone [Stenotrophomonas phage Salva]